jgi:hypothetical protein
MAQETTRAGGFSFLATSPLIPYQGVIVEVISHSPILHPGSVGVAVVLAIDRSAKSVFVPAQAPSEQTNNCPRPCGADREIRPCRAEPPQSRAGRAGEEFVVELEGRQLAQLGRQNLSHKIRWVADEEGDGAGYDVLSFAPTGQEPLLEVKTTNGSARTPFFLSRNDLEVSKERQEDWRIYRMHLFAASPRIFTLAPPLDDVLHLQPELWRASF